MAEWTFRCYLVGDDDVLDEWRKTHAADDKLLAKLDTRLRFLSQQPRDKWVRPAFDTLSHDWAGLGEVRFEYKNVQHRIFGFASGQMEFTFLVAATKKGSKFDPLNTRTTAHARKREVVADRSRARDCDCD